MQKALFYKSSSKLILFWDLLAATVNRWEEIKEILNRPAPPHVYEFDIDMELKNAIYNQRVVGSSR